ncbi:hypothetical protein TKK_0016997 [Trichogramma kaykai]
MSSSVLLHAVNGTAFKAFGRRIQTVDFGLRRDFLWEFMRAEVPYPIFGADAIYHFDLLPHLKRIQLIDNTTNLAVSGQLAFAPVTGISALDKLHPTAHLLP